MCSETLEGYSRQVRNLCQILLKYIALSLGLKEDVFEEMFGVCVQAARMNYYPPCPRPDLVMGLSPHSDGSALTVLQQGKGSSVGLQILKDNTWFPVQPVPNALVINIGDTMEVINIYSQWFYDFQVQCLNLCTVSGSDEWEIQKCGAQSSDKQGNRQALNRHILCTQL